MNKANSIEVIGAGLGRTGTLSLCEALKKLGYKPYHMIDGVFNHPSQLDYWVEYAKAYESGDRQKIKSAAHAVIDSMLGLGFNATTDNPACLLYTELAERFPQAKVILSVRSTPEKWAESFQATVARSVVQRRMPFKFFPFSRKFVMVIDWMEKQMKVERNSEDLLDINNLVSVYENWKEEVIRNIPKERLLIHVANDGWEPLCKFLGKPVPETPYPNLNDSKSMSKVFDRLEFVADYWWIVSCAIVLGLSIAIGYHRQG